MTSHISGESVSQFAKATGGISRTVAGLTSDPGDTEWYAQAFRDTFNADAKALRRYANDRLDAGDAVAAIRFTDRQGNRSRQFLVASAYAASRTSTGPSTTTSNRISIRHR